MFNSLRANSPIYIFHKNSDPYLEIGYVQTVNGPRPKYPMPLNIQLTLDLILDVLVKVGDSILTYLNLPAHQEITDTFSNGESIVISDNKNAINSEILNYQQKSKDIIASLETHEGIISKCDKLINDLNPEYAEKQLQQELINSLNNRIDVMTKNMEELMAANRRLLEQILKGETTI